MLQKLPARLPFHLLDIFLHQRFEGLEIETFQSFCLVVVIIDHYLFESSDMRLLQVLIENFFLKINQILVVHNAIAVFVANPEDSKQGFLVLWFYLLLDRVV
jgi:hypothetical protein